jgi:ribonucleotide monophosphatase NagD (HAD superfamily)
MRTFYEAGDTLIGDVIVAEARKISKPVIIIKTGRHKAQRIILKENAMSRIEKKLRYIIPKGE